MKGITITRLTAFTIKDVEEVKGILNRYVSFGLATDSGVYNLIKNHRVFIAKHQDEILGVLTMKKELDSIHIKHIAVKEDYRVRGISTKLTRYAINNHGYLHEGSNLVFKSTGWVKNGKWGAEPLAKRFGFEITDDLGDWSKVCKSSEDCPYYDTKCRCSKKDAYLKVRVG